jgi:hypothetical protein
MCLDLEVIPVMFAKKNNNGMTGLLVPSKNMGTSDGIWRKPFTHFCEKYHKYYITNMRAQLLSWSQTLHSQ